MMRPWGESFAGIDARENCCDVEQGKFKVGATYQRLTGPKEGVCWAPIVRNTLNLSRHAFTTWLAVNRRLLTADRLPPVWTSLPRDSAVDGCCCCCSTPSSAVVAIVEDGLVVRLALFVDLESKYGSDRCLGDVCLQ
ncbi:hypothetical protein Ancab_001616, partial [Ancistrocladus abbreviatus]